LRFSIKNLAHILPNTFLTKETKFKASCFDIKPKLIKRLFFIYKIPFKPISL